MSHTTMRVHTPPHRDAYGRASATYHFIQHPRTIAETLLCALVITEGEVTSLNCAPREDTQKMIELAKEHFRNNKP